MLKMQQAVLEQSVITHLATKQSVINSEQTYADQVAKGKSLWATKSVAQFRKIRAKLEKMCVGKRRCNYCEDSVADEVEHIKPKDIYPSMVFDWDNYLFACGNCNGPKNNSFAIFDANDEVIEVSRKPKDPVIPPQTGQDVFINPRFEDPLAFLVLDLLTMNFIPKPGISDIEKKRAKYTIDILKLNARDFLIEARKESYITYTDSLKVYVSDKNNGATQQDLLKKKNELESRQHPTVWAEMKRQRRRYQELDALFTQAQELLV